MKLNRKDNAIRNVGVGLINKVVTILLPFILRTVLIYTLGTQYLGLSSLFTSILQVLSLSELGIGSAMVFSLYRPIAEDNNEEVSKLLCTYKYVYRIIGCVIFFGGLSLLPFLKFLIHGECPQDVNIYVLYLCYLVNTAESYFISAYKTTLLSAYQRRDVVSTIGLSVKIVLYATQIVCLFLTNNYYLYVIWLPIFTAIENIISAKYVERHYKGYFANKYEVNIKEAKPLLAKVRDLFGHRLEQVVINTFDTISISAFLGLKLVTIYNNYYYLMSAVSGVFDILYHAVLAGIGNSLVIEDEEKNLNDFKFFQTVNSWMVGWSSICFLCLYQPMMQLWMGKKLMLPYRTIVLLFIYFYVWKIRQTVLLYKDAAGMWKEDRWKPYVEIIANIIMNVTLIKVIGIDGVIIATIISMLFVAYPWETVVFFKHRFEIYKSNFYRRQILHLLITLILAIITYLACELTVVEGIIGFLVKGLICIILPNTVVLLLFHRNADVKRITSIGCTLIKNMKKKL